MTTIILALTILWEAGGCGPAEMRRVASVIHTRKWDGRYGRDWESVCFKRLAFSCWNNREKDAKSVQRYADQEAETDATLWFQCVTLAMQLQEGTFIPTIAATHFWRHDAKVSASMAALEEVDASLWHTFRREER